MEDDYVNGTQCAVEACDQRAKALRVVTKTGHRLAITLWTDVDKLNAVYYPARAGYASTIHRSPGRR
eukprot:15456391-Alexandrium_andersonii.AAC.1